MVSTAPTALVGRAEELAAVRSALNVRGCVVAGAAGVGKSRLAAEAVGKEPALRVLATRSAAAVPFGAFAHLVPPGSERADVIPAFIQMLRADYARRVPVVLVDDGHLLDDASAALALALATTGAGRLLVTLRTGESAPDAISALWKEQGVERVELQNLGRADVGQLIREELDGGVDPVVVTRIADLSLGNPLYVWELLNDARNTGALEQTDAGWRWNEELLAFDRLSVLIERRTGTVSAAARGALEIVSVIERVPLAVLAALTSDTAVEELERDGLVRVAPDAPSEVTVAHPLYGEVVAAQLPRTAAIRIRREAAVALRAEGADPLRIAALLLDSGTEDPPLFLEASGAALRRGGIRLEARLARAAGESLDAAMATAAALVDLGHFDAVGPVLAPYEAAAALAPLETSVEYLSARCRALLRGSGPDDERTALLDRARSWHAGSEWNAMLAAEDGWSALYSGRLTDALQRIEGAADGEGVTARRRFHLQLIAVNVYYRLARFDDGLVAAENAERTSATMAHQPSEVRLGLISAKVHPAIATARDLIGTGQTLRATRAEALANGDRPLVSLTSMLLGQLALQRGHATDAVAYLDEAAASLTDADAMNDGLYTATMHVSALALHGDADRAAAVLEQVERLAQLQPRNAEKHAPLIATARALVEGAAGRTSAAAERLLAVAGAGHNHPAGEITALYEALRHGADPRAVADGLRARLVDAQHELADLFAVHADALADDDAGAQMAVAKRLHDLGCDLFAAEAAARAARAFADAGRKASSREAVSLAAQYAAACGHVASWALQLRPEAPALTVREREIAVLAARGRTNKQIAEELFLSVRTVESHLLNACQKLGVENRRKLVEVIDV